RQRHEASVDAQCIGTCADGRTRVPAAVAGGDVVDPAFEVIQRLGGEAEELAAGGLLPCQPCVVELLAAPAGFAELVEPDHARAALERVERASNGGELFNVARR